MADNLERLINDESEYGSCVVLRIGVTKRGGVYMQDENGEETLTACFKKMTIDDNMAIERLSYEKKSNENGMDISASNFLIYRTILLRRLLLSIDDFKPERKNGWIVEKDWNIIKNYNGMIVSHLVDEYEKSISVSDDDEKLLGRQSAVLFGVDNGKVSNPHPGISMYCTLGSIWEKFGIDVSKLGDMTFDKFLLIKQIMGSEAEQQRKNFRK